MSKVAIHKSTWGFSKEWINYCKKKEVPFKIVNCYDSNIIEQLKECDILLWHHHHTDAKDVLFAEGLLYALEQSGKKVFPNFNTGWHFDDKVGQKYLLEAINAPLVKTWVFYEKKTAIKWANNVSYPKVFKLRGGAGSTNVKLVKNKKQALKKIEKAFGKGFPAYDRINDLKEQYLRYKQGKLKQMDALKSLRRFFVSTRFARTVGNQKGYIYFQEFIPNNEFDIRVIIIGDRAFGAKRMVRPNDFRASGSGNFSFERKDIALDCVKLAFKVTEKLKAQCIAYDFVYDEEGNPLIVEINYGFAYEGYMNANESGYFDNSLKWHKEKINPMHWMIENLIKA